MFEKFKNWVENHQDYAKQWKKNTRSKVIGYFCTCVPEEILYAVDVLPVRCLGGYEPQKLNELHRFPMPCPLQGNMWAKGLKDKYDYLDGIMIAHSCLPSSEDFTKWDIHQSIEFSYYLPMHDHLQSPAFRPFLRSELEKLKEAVKKWTHKTLRDADLSRGIEIVNTNRILLRRIFELTNLRLTGKEAMYIVLSSQIIDKREHNKALKELLDQLPNRKLSRSIGNRLVVLGSENDDVLFADNHCTGRSYFLNEVVPQEDRLQAIADRYIDIHSNWMPSM